MAVVSRIVVRNSDISGVEGAETFSQKTITFKVPGFTLDLTPAEIEDVEARITELNEAVAELVNDTLGDYLTAYAALAAAGANTSGGAATGTKNVVREWAIANNLPVGERGRISQDILNAYAAAHSDRVTNLDSDQDDDNEPTDAELAALDAEFA